MVNSFIPSVGLCRRAAADYARALFQYFCPSLLYKGESGKSLSEAGDIIPVRHFIRILFSRQWTHTVMLALLACLFCSSGCAEQIAESPAEELTERQLAADIDPAAWHLSKEGQRLYYYLLLAEAIADNSEEVLSEALKNLLELDPSLPIFQDSATIHLSRGDFEEAERTALEGLKHFPGDSLLTLLLAGAYSENDQQPKAIGILEEFIKQNPEEQDIAEELVRLYLNEGQEDKAAELLSKLPEKAKTLDSELFRARVLASVGRTAEARKSLQELLKKSPDMFEAWVELGFLSEREKESNEAIKAYERALELMPDNPEIYFRIALLQIQSKQPDKAMETLNKASPSQGLFIQAALRFADGKYFREAEILLDKAAQAGADPDEIALFSSMFKQEGGKDPKDGLAPLKSISADSKLYPSALQQQIRIYIQAKEYAKAHSVAKEGRVLFPDRRELWGLEAFSLVKLKEGAQAEELLRKALQQYPGDEQILFSLATVLDELDKKEQAMAAMEQIISANSKHYQALNYVGYTLAEKNIELERAYELIRAALEQSPDSDYIIDSLAWVQYRLGHFEEAWESINRCITLGGDEATMWEHYGDIAFVLGKFDEAAKGYTEAIVRKPDNIAEVRKKLAALQKD